VARVFGSLGSGVVGGELEVALGCWPAESGVGIAVCWCALAGQGDWVVRPSIMGMVVSTGLVGIQCTQRGRAGVRAWVGSGAGGGEADPGSGVTMRQGPWAGLCERRRSGGVMWVAMRGPLRGDPFRFLCK